MKLRVLLFCLMVILAPQVKAEPAKSLSSLLPKFEALIQKSMKEKKIPGLAVAIVKDGKIVFMKGFGVRTVGHPERVTTHTRFQLGSTSKAITSALVAILVKKKILSLSQPVETIPEATLWHLLTHTTGIPSWGFNTLIEKGVSATDIYKRIQETPPNAPPGQQFSYHNAVYSLIGGVVEQQTKLSFEEALQKWLFGPLHMTETSSTWEPFISSSNRVSVHAFVNGKEKKGKKGKKGKAPNTCAVKVPYRKEYGNFPASAGCTSSIHDMALFLAAILGARPDILSPQDLEDFIQPLVHTPDSWHRSRAHRDRITKTDYGLGWRTMTFGGYHVVSHPGWIRGINCWVSFIPEKRIGLVVMQNVEANLPFTLIMQFYDWFLGLPPKQWMK